MGKIKEAIELNKEKEGYSLKDIIGANRKIVVKLQELSDDIFNKTGVRLNNSFIPVNDRASLEGCKAEVDEFVNLYNKANLSRTFSIDGTDLRVDLSGTKTTLYKEIPIGHSDSFYSLTPYDSDFYIDSFNTNQIKINCQDDSGDYDDVKVMDLNDILTGIKVSGSIQDIIKTNL